MYKPKYKITDKMLDSLIKLELARKEIRQTTLSATVKQKLVRQMRLEDLYSVGLFLNTDLTREDIRGVFTGKQVNPKDLSIKLLVNYRNAVEFIQASIHDKFIDLDPNLLLHINKVLTTGIVDSWDTGRFRITEDSVETKFDNWVDKSKIVKSNIDYRLLFFELMNWLKDQRNDTHPMLKIGIFLYEIERYAPFPAGNTITMVAITEMLFAQNRFSLGGLFPVAKPFFDKNKQFIESLKNSLEKEDNTDFLEIFIAAISEQMSTIRDEVYRLQDQKIAKRNKKLIGLNPRQLKTLRYIKTATKISRIRYMKMFDVSTMTAYRDLKELVKKGLISENGKGRGTYYVLIKPFEQSFEETVGKSDEEFTQEIETLTTQKPKMVFGSAEEVAFSDESVKTSVNDPFEEYT